MSNERMLSRSSSAPPQNRWHRTWLVQFALYGIVAVLLSLLVGVSRTWARFLGGDLPDQYLLRSVAFNAVAMLSLALPAFFLGFLAARRWGRRRGWTTRESLPVVVFLGVSSAYLLFWGLNTGIGFRVMREFFAGKFAPVIRETALWGPGLIALPWLGSWLAKGAGGRRLIGRGALLGLLLVSILGGFALYAVKDDPSAAPRLSLRPSAHWHPMIFLVLVDTLRADHLSAYGYPKPTSPHVDRLAEEGRLFERAFSQAPWTRPSCATLLSSRLPSETGMVDTFSALPKDIPILPQFLQREGYRTAGIVASVQLSPQFGFDKGFDLLDIGSTYLTWTGLNRPLSRLGLTDYRDIYPRYNARELTNRAIAWIRKARSEEPRRPLFMYMHYADPHAPYRPPPAEDRWREFADGGAARLPKPPFSPTWGPRPEGARLAAMVARYDAEVAYFDKHFGRFLRFLRRRGLFDDALVIFTADHGEEFSDHGDFTHGHTLYNELLHVPLVVKYPRRLANQNRSTVSSDVGLVDVVPTIRDVLGATWSKAVFRGKSLLDRPVEGEEPLYAGAALERKGRNGHPAAVLRALIEGPKKLIQRVDHAGKVESELYFSLARDFAEKGTGKVPPSLPTAVLEQMRRRLAALDSLGRRAPQEVKVDAATLRELKALGYVQ